MIRFCILLISIFFLSHLSVAQEIFEGQQKDILTNSIEGISYSCKSYSINNVFYNRFAIFHKRKADKHTICTVDINFNRNINTIDIFQVDKDSQTTSNKTIIFKTNSNNIKEPGTKPIYCVKNYAFNDTLLSLTHDNKTDILFTIVDTISPLIFLHQIISIDQKRIYNLDKFAKSYLTAHLTNAINFWKWNNENNNGGNRIPEPLKPPISGTPQTIILPTKKAVHQTMTKGDKIIDIGIGLFEQLPGNLVMKLTFPTIPISFEYIVKDDLFNGKGALGIGGFLGYTAARYDGYIYGYKCSRFIIGARGYIHYIIVKKLDTYGGFLVGYKRDISKFRDLGNGSDIYFTDEKFTGDNPTFNIFAGCRYFFNNKIAGMAELGWGVSIINIGLAVKL